MNFWQWFYPGLHFKRWLLLAIVGIIIASAGVSILVQSEILGLFEFKLKTIVLQSLGYGGKTVGGIGLLFLGLAIIFYSFKRAVKVFLNAAFPEHTNNRMKNVYHRQYLRRGPRVVAIGGGTGLSVLLRGLKEYTSNITAIVSVADDGGSSGIIRGQFGILPPGDLRNCLVALADTEPAMEMLFNYRFGDGNDFAGHNLGNLLITALADSVGNFQTAIHEISKVLAIHGKVIPSTLDDIVLAAELRDGSMVRGETNISKSSKPIKKVFTIPNSCKPVPEAIEAILEADAVVLGPGSLYTSVIPNLLVPGLVEVITKSKALKVYVCNVMTQPGETESYKASDHLKALYRHTVPGLVDYIIVNNQKVAEEHLQRYALVGSQPVDIDKEKLSKMKIKLISAPLIDEENLIHHNSTKVARQIIQLILDKRIIKPFPNIIDHYILTEKLKKGEENNDFFYPN